MLCYFQKEFRKNGEFRTGENTPFDENFWAAKSFDDQKTPIMIGKTVCQSQMIGKQLGQLIAFN